VTELSQKSDQASQLLRENGELESEVKELRQRWRTMILLMKRPRGLQSLSVLLSGPGEQGNVDDYMRCFDALLLPDEKKP
jgi:hypothetical protein